MRQANVGRKLAFHSGPVRDAFKSVLFGGVVDVHEVHMYAGKIRHPIGVVP